MVFLEGEKKHFCNMTGFMNTKSAVRIMQDLQENLDSQSVHLEKCSENESVEKFLGVIPSSTNNVIESLKLININLQFLNQDLTIKRSHGIHTSSALNHLDLESTIINNKIADMLAFSLANNSKIKSLILFNCKLTEYGLLALLSVLKNINTLQNFNLNSNKISEDVATSLASFISQTIDLNTLNIGNCQLSSTQFRTIAGALRCTSRLKCLNSDYNS